MAPIRFVLFVLLVVIAASDASPIRPENYADMAYGLPIFIQDPSGLEGEQESESLPGVYAFFLAGPGSGQGSLAKRSVEEPDLEDLETAAGTNALRPLFVYRQQVAYRQRVREAIRRRNRF